MQFPKTVCKLARRPPCVFPALECLIMFFGITRVNLEGRKGTWSTAMSDSQVFPCLKLTHGSHRSKLVNCSVCRYIVEYHRGLQTNERVTWLKEAPAEGTWPRHLLSHTCVCQTWLLSLHGGNCLRNPVVLFPLVYIAQNTKYFYNWHGFGLSVIWS